MLNNPDLPVGFAVENWTPPPYPPRTILAGRLCRLEPLDPKQHAADLYAANSLDTEGRNWTYLAHGPFATFEDYLHWVESVYRKDDPQFYAIVDNATDKAVGVASYLRIDPANGVIEVGSLNYSPLLQRTPAATEAMYLMMKNAFALGYRRYEWKCNSFNAPSCAAAERFGFTFEGVFRQAAVVKGHNRDTTWYSILDSEWPTREEAFLRWLSPDNFDENGMQRVRLGEFLPLPAPPS